VTPPTYPYPLPALRHPYDAYAPHVDATTMRIHHDRHHRAYVDALNALLAGHPHLHGRSVEDLLRNLGDVPADLRPLVRHHAGGHANHQFLWKIIRPGPERPPEGLMAEQLTREFGSPAAFKAAFRAAAGGLLGPGWVFLVADPRQDHRLRIVTTAGQQSVLPLGLPALMGCDLWEHAYYLRHQDRWTEHLDALWNVVDWQVVEQRYRGALERRAHL